MRNCGSHSGGASVRRRKTILTSRNECAILGMGFLIQQRKGKTMMEFKGKLEGKIALVAGATRGAGRGIACMLGEAGATVYCTGRSIRGKSATKNRPETIEETAEMVTSRGGKGIYVQVDHTDREQVKSLFERVKQEQNGRLDVLVNDMTGDAHMERKPFIEHSLGKGLKVLENGSISHIITSFYGIPLMVENEGGLIVEVTDGISYDLPQGDFNFYYDLEKAINIRLAQSLARQLREHKIAVVSLTPGFLRSEEMLDNFGVTEENWRDGIKKNKYFAYSETPFYVGKAVVALACDREVMMKSGRALISGKLAREYGFTDIDGTQPVWCY
jgi:NAD(P)-dependent dehydrogenase (short-subunit alcohol dehydrogenase family)